MPQMKSELCASICIGEADGKEEEEREIEARTCLLWLM